MESYNKADLRLECLKLAQNINDTTYSTDHLINSANRIYEYILKGIVKNELILEAQKPAN